MAAAENPRDRRRSASSSVADFVEITRSTPEKSLVRPLPKKGGRNNQGT